MAEDNRSVLNRFKRLLRLPMQFAALSKPEKHLAGAAKGAAAGGPYGAAAGFVWENRKVIGKIIIALIAFMMIPIMLLCMLPSLIFGGLKDTFSPDDPDTPILNSSVAVNANLADISTVVSTVLSESMTDTLKLLKQIFQAVRQTEKKLSILTKVPLILMPTSLSVNIAPPKMKIILLYL